MTAQEPAFEDDAVRRALATEEWEAMRAESAERAWHNVIPARFRSARVNDFTGAAAAHLCEWARHAADGVNLVIYGAVGVGKTAAACAALRRGYESADRVGFLSAGEMLDEMRPGGLITLPAVAALAAVVIDDLGLERRTDWTSERIDMLVNRRWMDTKATVVTTNLEPGALEAHVGARAFSRLVGGAVVLRLTGRDRRRIS